MTIFELINNALQHLEEEGKETYGDKLDEEVKARFPYLSDSYKKLTDKQREPIDYSDPATRFAYVYKYTGIHGDFLVQSLIDVREKTKDGAIFGKEEIVVTCLGGGPGSDIIGLMKYLERSKDKEPVKKVTCYLLDKEYAWSESWTGVAKKMDFGVTLEVHFIPVDATDKKTWKAVSNAWKADLFIMSFFMSELYSLDQEVINEFWARVFEKAQPGAAFLYHDNNSWTFNNYLAEVRKKAGLELTYSWETKFTPSSGEEKSVLGKYLQRFGLLKLTGDVAFRWLEKPQPEEHD